MTSGPPYEAMRTFVLHDQLRPAAVPGRFEEPFARQYASSVGLGLNEHALTYHRQRLQRTGERDPWTTAIIPTTNSRFGQATPGTPQSQAYPSPSIPLPGPPILDRMHSPYGQYASQPPRWTEDDRGGRRSTEYRDAPPRTPWPALPDMGRYYTQEPPISSGSADSNARGSYTSNWQPGSYPAPLLHRSSSEDIRLAQMSPYYTAEVSGANGQQSKAFPQRRPSNRDEFDGPSQLLSKPDETIYEPNEDELPQLPITLYAQEQDEILSQVNDRLSQCAFDFVAKYQFPIPVEPDKRPVRVPSDREWSEWVYLLKRLATKRRIPARVLYNNQIKQLITILENSLEMRHAAKHQSRPLKDDRNILQLISSGLQVAKILKDSPAMQYLDGLYVQTERQIQGRRAALPATPIATS